MLTFEQIELLKTTIAKGLTDLEFQLFLSVCERTGLDPFARQICPVLRWDSKSNKNIMSVQVQVDGYRMIAQSTGEYAGCDRVRFDDDLTLYEHCQTKRGNPETASITVYRLVKGIRCPFFAEVSWNDFYPGDKLGFMWKSKPHQMISKCFSSDTEILTTSGFERFDSVTGQVLQVTDTGLSATNSKPFCQNYSGEMIQCDGDMLNFSVTPNHDMVTTFGKVEAGAMFATSRTRPVWRIPLCMSGSSVDAAISDRVLELTGYVAADGSHSGYKQWRMGVSRPYKIDKLRALNPDSEGVQHSRGNVAVTQSREIRSNFDKAMFAFSTDLTDELIDSNKALNTQKILSLSRRQARILLDAWQLFDGCTSRLSGSRIIITTRKDHVQAIELLAVIAGYSVNVPRARMSDISTKPAYSITLSETSSQPVVLQHSDRTGIHKVPNDADHVWCVTVPSGVIIVRRNGFSMVCGNCVESQALRKAFQSELKHLVTEEEIAIEGVDPTTRQVRRSDDWFDMQTQLREAGSIEEVNAIAASTRDRMPMTGNSYQMDKELEIASERLGMTTIPNVARSLPSKPAAKPSAPSDAPQPEASEPATEKKPSNENSKRIKEVCELLGMKGKMTAEAYKAAAPVQGLNKPSEELTSAECSQVIDEILAQWGLRQKCFRAIDHARNAFALLMESLEVSVTMPEIVASWKAECDRRLAEKSQEVPAATW